MRSPPFLPRPTAASLFLLEDAEDVPEDDDDGTTDVEDLMNRKSRTSGNFSEAWLGSAMDRAAIAKRVSPTTYVRKGLPPIMIILGTADSVVPFDQATKLKKLLAVAATPNELYVVDGGGHGGWTTADMEKVYSAIRVFLTRY